jgi:enoyl-CoA hydratase/carnithine racemase
METLKYEKLGPVGWVRLNRPEKLNAMTGRMWRELADLGAELIADPELRCVVVIGEGRAFSAGIDTAALAGSDDNNDGTVAALAQLPGGHKTDDPLAASILHAQEAYNWLQDAPFPTIAAVRGYALGAGLQLALAADIRVVAEGTKLGMLEFKYALMPDLGGTQRLPRVVGVAKALELIMTADQIDANEALRIGLANRLVTDDELESVVTALADKLAAQPPIAARNAKKAVHAAFTGTVRDGLIHEATGQAECIRSDDFKEAIAAFVERRTPVFRNR